MVGFSRISNFPNVIGAVDGTHIAIKAISFDTHIFVNRRNVHSINMMTVCDAISSSLTYSKVDRFNPQCFWVVQLCLVWHNKGVATGRHWISTQTSSFDSSSEPIKSECICIQWRLYTNKELPLSGVLVFLVLCYTSWYICKEHNVPEPANNVQTVNQIYQGHKTMK